MNAGNVVFLKALEVKGEVDGPSTMNDIGYTVSHFF